MLLPCLTGLLVVGESIYINEAHENLHFLIAEVALTELAFKKLHWDNPCSS